MDRIVGLETEYGCLLSGGDAQATSDAWPVKVKNYLFRKAQVGAIDLHYRDYEEPPGNGGFLLNGGRLYLDMGHIEYASPECLHLRDMVTYDLAGDRVAAVRARRVVGASDRVSFHQEQRRSSHRRDFWLPRELFDAARGAIHSAGSRNACSRFWRRDRFSPVPAGSGRRIRSRSISRCRSRKTQVDFQISQRADHIVNDIYQWVQFNRAIINARDEPLADYRKYRRLHLLIGDSNMSPFATALKIGTTACVLVAARRRPFAEESDLARCGPKHARYFARPDAALDRATGKWQDNRRARHAMAVS